MTRSLDSLGSYDEVLSCITGDRFEFSLRRGISFDSCVYGQFDVEMCTHMVINDQFGIIYHVNLGEHGKKKRAGQHAVLALLHFARDKSDNATWPSPNTLGGRCPGPQKT